MDLQLPVEMLDTKIERGSFKGKDHLGRPITDDADGILTTIVGEPVGVIDYESGRTLIFHDRGAFVAWIGSAVRSSSPDGEVVLPSRKIADGQSEVDMSTPGYEKLADVLQRAYNQAAHGKGKERHARDDEPFHEQVMAEMAKRFGTGALLAQAFKKSEESQRLTRDRGVAELLGAIVYLAGAVINRERLDA